MALSLVGLMDAASLFEQVRYYNFIVIKYV